MPAELCFHSLANHHTRLYIYHSQCTYRLYCCVHTVMSYSEVLACMVDDIGSTKSIWFWDHCYNESNCNSYDYSSLIFRFILQDIIFFFFFFNDPAPPEISPLPHPDPLPI